MDRRRPELLDDLDRADQDTRPPGRTFTGRCTCRRCVWRRTLTGHGLWAALAPLRYRRRRP